MAIVNTYCYKTKEPVYYNKGTQWEKTCDEFLLSYAPSDMERAKLRLDEMNECLRTKNYDRLTEIVTYRKEWEKIDYFFMHEQEEFY